ncbi:MAG TPA: 16S rRNA (cytosine(1402)-N(4))-methyltransferase RsmH [Candidatus Peribacterales bacterium]|nr:16S rRNA (cytosine(1402)-N(4))-methyltransferase RsmH [Candidatus Peribacterales bacterium]
MEHTPVLLREALESLDPKSGEVVIDVTLGLGGHAMGFLERIGSKGRLIGIDADQKNLETSRKNLQGKNVTLIYGNFRDLPILLSQVRSTAGTAVPQCDILFADLGLSSVHIDDPLRGFTFRSVSPLDCRFDQMSGRPASALLSEASEGELLRIFTEYGELPNVRLFVQAILAERGAKRLERSSDLVLLAEKVFTWRTKKFLPQIFQALRIAVNDEIGALSVLLEHGPLLLSQGGRMGVISYHSLEDRMVKERFSGLTQGGKLASYELLTKKPIKPTMEEVGRNPRSRSAILRILKKL